MIQHQLGNSHGNYHYNAYIYQDCYWVPHFHKSFELVYVMDGTAEISVNGVQETLHANEMILLCPYTVHFLRVENSRVWVGVFSEDFISAYAAKYKQTQFKKFRCDAQTLEILGNHLFVEGTPDRFLCISCLYLACHICSKTAGVYSHSPNNAFVFDVTSYVSQHLQKDISLKDVAAAMNYEYHYFSTLFNQAFSLKFKQFINLLRIENACRLLMDSPQTSVTQVSEACGFGSIRNFNRVFKVVYGCTPQEYRKTQATQQTGQ